MSGELDKHASSGALLLTPARQLSRCLTCCGGTCVYAIRAVPCWQIMDEECEVTLPSIWFCVESKCAGSEQDFSQIKTPVVFLYSAPWDTEERCWQTIPDSIMLVSKLPPEIAEDVITDTSLECIEEGCVSGECEITDDPCGCLCLSTDHDLDGVSDCCMSRIIDGVSPWTFYYRRTVVSTVQRTSYNGGWPGGGDCVLDDCNASAYCVFFAFEEEIDEAELAASYDPIIEQTCVKEVPIRSRITTRKIGFLPGIPFGFACCTADNDPTDWAAGGVLSVAPPVIIPYEEIVESDSGITPGPGDCFSRTLTTRTREGNCDYYLEVLTEELWTWANNAAETCGCQEYQKTITTVEYEFDRADDETTLRLCAQCAAVEAAP